MLKLKNLEGRLKSNSIFIKIFEGAGMAKKLILLRRRKLSWMTTRNLSYLCRKLDSSQIHHRVLRRIDFGHK